LLQFSAPRTEAQFAIKPERPRLDRLLIFVAKLVRIDGETSNSCHLMKEAKCFGINPCCLAVAVGIESVEADLHPLEEGNAFNVIDRHAILEREAGVIGP